MADAWALERVREVVGVPLSDEAAERLAAAYRVLAEAEGGFPHPELQGVEPPLRAIAGPAQP